VYIAGTLREAKQVEELLAKNNVDYIVKVEPYRTSILLGVRNGAAFYVDSKEVITCRHQLASAGFRKGLTKE
tara:strand:+ start:493 stop:708 length:216 start_codon:yes stop_codon:yes gene_type:complete